MLLIAISTASHRGLEGALTSVWTAKRAHKVVPKTTNHQNPKKSVEPRDFPYTARARMKKRTLLVFIARISKAALMYHSAWQFLTGATVV